MKQFYFLSILTNLVAGFVMVSDRLESFTFVTSIRGEIERPGFRVGLAFATFLVGFFKLLSATYGDMQVIGDLVPALTGLTLGWMLILEFYKSRSTGSSELLDRMEEIFLRNRVIFGALGITAGILHFFFPSVLLL